MTKRKLRDFLGKANEIVPTSSFLSRTGVLPPSLHRSGQRLFAARRSSFRDLDGLYEIDLTPLACRTGLASASQMTVRRTPAFQSSSGEFTCRATVGYQYVAKYLLLSNVIRS